ncbi:hypothetical protein MFM001_12130 [Mycobacterium sp. MFM001]|uniref:IclR family transcriptional regulator n=1 Tax=Mycobacterium sp. MFM001 TaxID=2049453 RepID=UPI000DA59CB3|nr:IclR family transcriptional regulator [Mycobacterium sp. MFM001]GBE64751.1 hypothetical protein MFM001_12130 [Mycobacterium sp. MFM001]
MAGNCAQPGATVTARVLALLAAFDSMHRRMRLSELARRAGIPVGTAHRLVGELEAWGALERLPCGRYVIGRRLWDVGLLAPVQVGLGEVASPFVHDLYASTGATVHLAVRDGISVLCVARLAGHASVPVISRSGTRLPIHATSLGKVLLAHAPETVQAAALSRLHRVTPRTIVHAGLLREQLHRARRDGYATAPEEMGLGGCGVAVPIFRNDEVVAAVGLVVAAADGDGKHLLPALRVTAQGISRTLDANDGATWV